MSLSALTAWKISWIFMKIYHEGFILNTPICKKYWHDLWHALTELLSPAFDSQLNTALIKVNYSFVDYFILFPTIKVIRQYIEAFSSHVQYQILLKFLVTFGRRLGLLPIHSPTWQYKFFFFFLFPNINILQECQMKKCTSEWAKIILSWRSNM
jgi:hypothetical protein